MYSIDWLTGVCWRKGLGISLPLKVWIKVCMALSKGGFWVGMVLGTAELLVVFWGGGDGLTGLAWGGDWLFSAGGGVGCFFALVGVFPRVRRMMIFC